MPKEETELGTAIRKIRIAPGMEIEYKPPNQVFYDIITDTGEPEFDDYTMSPETVSALRALERIHGHGILPENNESRKRVK